MPRPEHGNGSLRYPVARDFTLSRNSRCSAVKFNAVTNANWRQRYKASTPSRFEPAKSPTASAATARTAIMPDTA